VTVVLSAFVIGMVVFFLLAFFWPDRAEEGSAMSEIGEKRMGRMWVETRLVRVGRVVLRWELNHSRWLMGTVRETRRRKGGLEGEVGEETRRKSVLVVVQEVQGEWSGDGGEGVGAPGFFRFDIFHSWAK